MEQLELAFKELEERCRQYFELYVPDLNADCFVAGGSIPRLYHHLKVRDIDVYVNTQEVFDEFEKIYKEANYELKASQENFRKFLNPSTSVEVDLIHFHNPKSVEYVTGFDFSICQIAFSQNRLVDLCKSFPDIVNKKLRFTGNMDHVPEKYRIQQTSSKNILTRLKKYLSLGFEIEDEHLGGIYTKIFNSGFDAGKKFEKDDISKKIMRLVN